MSKILTLTHSTYGEMAINADAITEVAGWQSSKRYIANPAPRSTVAFGGNSMGWAFEDTPLSILERLSALSIIMLPATGACDRHGQSLWLVRDHIISAHANGEHTTDLRTRWNSDWRSVAIHEPCGDFVRRWQESYR